MNALVMLFGVLVIAGGVVGSARPTLVAVRAWGALALALGGAIAFSET